LSRSRVRTAGWRWQPVPPGLTRRLDVDGSQFKSRPPRESERYRDSRRLRLLRPGQWEDQQVLTEGSGTGRGCPPSPRSSGCSQRRREDPRGSSNFLSGEPFENRELSAAFLLAKSPESESSRGFFVPRLGQTVSRGPQTPGAVSGSRQSRSYESPRQSSTLQGLWRDVVSVPAHDGVNYRCSPDRR